jgi:hypothetical protein
MADHSGSHQGRIIVCLLAAGVASVWLAAERAGCRPVEAGFWFEPVAFASARLGGAVTDTEFGTIAAVARLELDAAFADLGITLSDRRGATFRVRVVDELRDMRFRRVMLIPAQSRAVSGFGGAGEVSFSWLASAALAYAPDEATRPALVEAIGKGVGRAAVHEFVHQFLPTTQIHASDDVESYEYRSASRRQQYFGPMHWDVAWPMLAKRLPPCGADLQS